MHAISEISINRVVKKLQSVFQIMKSRKNSDPRNFDWNWKAKSYNRIALVNLLARNFVNAEYLEIGCDNNSLFDSVYFERKTGVDPLKGGNVRSTSDHFFEASSTFFDLIFVDGLHTYEQVRRDVFNSLRHLTRDGYIAIHDMLPSNWIDGHVPRLSNGNWTGDVWKLGFELQKIDGLNFKIVEIDNGVGVIRKSDQFKEESLSAFSLLEKENFSYFADNKDKLPIISWREFTEWVTGSIGISN